MAEKNSCAFRTSIGGQALIEGILMRGPHKQAIVVRDKDGQLVEKVEELKLIKDRHPILGVPLIRGVVNFLDSMIKGVQALMYSADFYPEEEVAQPSKFELWVEQHLASKKAESFVVGLAVAMGIALSVLLFLILPTSLTGLLLHWLPGFPLWGRNLLEAVLKIAIFMAYLIFCSKQKDIYRVFQYHGAEHKTINAYEAQAPLTPESVGRFSLQHPRCGTAFLLTVVVISIIMYSFLPPMGIVVRILSRLLLLPIIAAKRAFIDSIRKVEASLANSSICIKPPSACSDVYRTCSQPPPLLPSTCSRLRPDWEYALRNSPWHHQQRYTLFSAFVHLFSLAILP